jgi:ribosomal protein S4
MEKNKGLDPQKIRALRLDKMLVEAGFVSSGTEAVRKIRARAVKVMGKEIVVPVITVIVPCELPTVLGRQAKVLCVVE